ncbi:MAG TPA: RDD family protein [Mycobacteriales bacterium]|nr:RDD family protein [Mycobacteriales bacterium]
MGELLVTGEAVVLEVRLARLPSRALALGLDVLVQAATLIMLLFAVGALISGGEEAFADALGLVVIVAVLVGYPVTAETLTRGRTLGKLALGLRVVRDDGGPIAFRHALARGLFAVFPDIWASGGSAALITSVLNRHGKRLGDIVAGTVVVQERLPVRPATRVDMPAPLAGWAAGVDLSGLPDDLALAARQFLARAPELEPGAREDVGRRLGAAIAEVVHPPPPAGTPAVAYLSAVLAERRRRADRRLASATPSPAPPRATSPPALAEGGRRDRADDPVAPEQRASPRRSPFEPPT